MAVMAGATTQEVLRMLFEEFHEFPFPFEISIEISMRTGIVTPEFKV